MTLDEAFRLVTTQYEAGNFQQAEDICKELLEKLPNNAEILYFLGIISLQLHQSDSAIHYLQRSLRINSAYTDAYLALGTAFQQKGLLDEALLSYQKTIELDPANAASFNLIGTICKDSGELDDAIVCYQKAVQLNPDFYEAYCNLGSVLLRKEITDAAIAQFQKALRLQPELVDAHNMLGCALKDKGQLDGAILSFQKAIQLNPDHPEIYNNLGMAYQTKGQIDEAETCFRHAIQMRKNCSFYSNLLFNMLYNGRHSEKTIYIEHLGFAAQCADFNISSLPPYANDRDPSRRLKIGYVSPDFMDHSVTFFIEPILLAHRRDQCEVFCYSNVSVQDHVTNRIKGYEVQWRDIAGMSDEDASELIRKEKIDLLVDLAGHTAYNRLLLFARKPAPVQISWIGYPATTGLPTIDYKIVDYYTDPPGTTEQFYSEKLMRLPESFLCYLPQKDAPDIGPLPALKNGYITFGCFNNFAKISTEAYSLWSDILRTVSGSRLILKWKSFSDKSTCEYAKNMFQQRGVHEERVILESWAPSPQYLQSYNNVDIGLDTFPFNGITTTCQALWMGVPVISLSGTAYASRGGVSLLSNVGIPELLAKTPDEYREIAVGLAKNLKMLKSLRERLREKMMYSPLCDAQRFIADLETCYRKMWATWCNGV
jgi:protein O-GlcNAc transferase